MSIKGKSIWAAPDSTSRFKVSSKYPEDHIQTYLQDDPIFSTLIEEAGGYMKYWFTASKNQPLLAKMGQDFCFAPGLYFVF